MNLAQALLSIPSPKARQPRVMPFGEWAPDMPDYANPGLTIAKNVIPDTYSYEPFKDFVAQSSNALSARCQGMSGAISGSATSYVYAGDATKLYGYTAGTWSDVSGATYSTAANGTWEFAQYGSGVFIATNGVDQVQSISPGGANFADMMTSTLKPLALHVGVVGQFVVLGNTNDTTDGPMFERVWWSAIRDQTDFDPAASTQCDYEDLKFGGRVTKIVGGVEYGLIFTEKALWRMTYIGSPVVFRFDPVDRRHGTNIPNSVIGHGRLVYYINDEGFQVTDGTASKAIGENKVDDWFWDQFDIDNASRVSTAIDEVNKLIMWLFPGDGNTSGNPNKLAIFHWTEGRWSYVDIDLQMIGNTVTRGLTLEQVGALYSNLDTDVPTTLDDLGFSGGLDILAGFNNTHYYGQFTGSPLQATLETGTIQLIPGRRSETQRIRPIVNGSSSDVSVQVSAKEELYDADSFAGSTTINSIGDTTSLANGRYHKFRTIVAAGGTWSDMQGIELETIVKGHR